MTVELLQGMMDAQGKGDFRFLSDDIIREVRIDAGVYHPNNMYHRGKLLSLLPPFPQGQWTRGRIFRDDSQQVQFEVDSDSSPANTVPTWHPFRMHLLSQKRRLTNNRLWMVEGPVLLGPPKFDCVMQHHEGSWIRRRARANQPNNNANDHVPCSFLGHVQEGRLKGYLLQMGVSAPNLKPGMRMYRQATIWLKEDILSYDASQEVRILSLDDRVQILANDLMKYEWEVSGTNLHQELGLE